MQITGFTPTVTPSTTPPPTAAITPTRTTGTPPTQTRNAVRGASRADRTGEGEIFQPKDPTQGSPAPDMAARRGWMLDMLA
jgi:hypothetical protein